MKPRKYNYYALIDLQLSKVRVILYKAYNKKDLVSLMESNGLRKGFDFSIMTERKYKEHMKNQLEFYRTIVPIQ